MNTSTQQRFAFMRLLALCTVSTATVAASSVYVVCPLLPLGTPGVQVLEIDTATGTNTSLLTIPELKSYLTVTAVDVESQTFLIADNEGAAAVFEVSLQNKNATPTTWASPFNSIALHNGEFYGRTSVTQSHPAQWISGSLSGGAAGGHVVSTLAPNTMYPPGGSYDADNDRFHYLGLPDSHQYLQTDMKTGKTSSFVLPKDVFLESVAWDSKKKRVLGLGISGTTTHDCAFFEIDPHSGASTVLFQTPGVVCSLLTSIEYEPLEARWYVYFGNGDLLQFGVAEQKVLRTTKIRNLCLGMAVL